MGELSFPRFTLVFRCLLEILSNGSLSALKRRQHSIAVQAVTGLINSSLENFFLSALKPWKALTEVLHVLRLHADRRQGLSTDRQARDGVRKEKERLTAA